MKSRIFAAAVIVAACPAAAWAFDWTPDTTRYLSDPSFMPDAGQLYSMTSLSNSTVNEDWRYISGAKTQHYLGLGDSASQDFAYGITDRLMVSGAAEYTVTRNKDTYLNFQPDESTTHNVSNPTFAVDYRMIDQRSAPVNVDGKVLYVPSIVSNGVQSGGGEVFVSREWRSLTLQGFAATHYYNPTNGKTTNYWDYYAGLEDQLRLAPRWAVNSGLQIVKRSGFEFDNQSTGIAYTSRQDSSVLPYIALQYHLYPNRIVVGVQYEHEFVGDDHYNGSYHGTWTNNSDNIIALHLRMLFF